MNEEIEKQVKQTMGFMRYGAICKHCNYWEGISYSAEDDKGYKCSLNPSIRFETNELSGCKHFRLAEELQDKVSA